MAKPVKIRKTDKSCGRLAQLKALAERLHGSGPNFMTLEDLMKMREMDKPEIIGHVPPHAS